MELGRSDEQRELADTVRGLLTKRADSRAVRATMATPDGLDHELWETLCGQLGVAGLPIPEEYAGAGAGLVETAVVLEELGYSLAAAPLLSSALSAAALLLYAGPDARAELLPGIAGGAVTAIDLTGGPVLDAAQASATLALRDGALVRLVDPDVDARTGLDPTLRFALLSGGRHHELGKVEDPAPLMHIARALTSALQVGCLQRGLDMTVAYAKERVQFGRPIGSFQALKHRMADLLVLVESSRSASWAATWAAAAYLQEPTAPTEGTLARQATVARDYCTRSAVQVAGETIQLHGGIAITWEHDAHLVFKRAHALGELYAE